MTLQTGEMLTFQQSINELSASIDRNLELLAKQREEIQDLTYALKETVKSLKWCKTVYGGDWSQSANIVEIIDDAEKTLNKVKS